MSISEVDTSPTVTPATPRDAFVATTVQTPDGDFSVILGADAVLASGWTADIGSLVALIHPRLRPPHEDVLVVDPANVDAAGTQTAGTDAAGTEPRATNDHLLHDVVAAVAAYYDGDLAALDSIPVRQVSGEFRMHAWDVLREVEPGAPITYSEYAARSGRPAAVRAAAGACALNAAALFVPCHRVLRTDGSLGGFRYGLAIKERLLEREAPAHGTSPELAPV